MPTGRRGVDGAPDDELNETVGGRVRTSCLVGTTHLTGTIARKGPALAGRSDSVLVRSLRGPVGAEDCLRAG